MALIYCSECGKQISDKATKCPGCGNIVGSSIEKTDERSTDGLAITGMILGIVALSFDLITGLLLFFLTDILAITGLIFSIIGIVTSRKNNKKGCGMAITGTILSGVTLLFQLFRLMFVSAFFL